LIALLVSASVLADLVVMSTVSGGIWGPLGWPHPAFVLAVALCGSQVSLVAIWVGAGGGRFPWRLAGFFAAVGFWSVLSQATCPNTAPATSDVLTKRSVLLFMEPVFIVWVLFPLRMHGVRLVRAVNGGSTASGSDARTPRQFPVSYLLAWMTAIAVVSGTLRYLVLNGFAYLPLAVLSEPDYHRWQWIVTLALLWVVLGPRRLISTVPILCLVLLLGLLLPFSVGGKPALVEATFLVVSFCAIRAAGYRLRRDRADRSKVGRNKRSAVPARGKVAK